MIHKIEFSARNLTSNASLFLLLEHARKNGIFDLINNDLVFENASTNKIKMNHIKTMLCGNLIGIDKLERLKLLQNDPLINEFDISIKEPETVSRFLGNFSYKTTQMLREINFKVFRKLLRRRPSPRWPPRRTPPPARCTSAARYGWRAPWLTRHRLTDMSRCGMTAMTDP